MAKRKAEELASQAQEEAKRVKTAVNSAMDEYLCPITHELPIEPVMAEDGKIYEKSAIAEWLGRHQRSPCSNEAMGTKLMPATQVRNMIELLVKNGVINGEKVTRWKTKLGEDEKLKLMLAGAEAGNKEMIYGLGVAYQFGFMGLAKDSSAALRWFRRGVSLDDPRSLALAGECQTKGHGGAATKTADGLILLARAADRSNRAAYLLGEIYLRGEHGVEKDVEQAKYWLEKVVNKTCSVQHLKDDTIEEARKMLNEAST